MYNRMDYEVEKMNFFCWDYCGLLLIALGFGMTMFSCEVIHTRLAEIGLIILIVGSILTILGTEKEKREMQQQLKIWKKELEDK